MYNGAMLECVTASPEETRRLGEAVGALLSGGEMILLSGDLGAGKTTFVQGLARGMGIEDPVTSPTFTLIQEYGSDARRLIHVDPYRLASEEELVGIGYEDYLESDATMAVEWSERLGSLAPMERLEVQFDRLDGDYRRVALVPHGDRYAQIVEQVKLC